MLTPTKEILFAKLHEDAIIPSKRNEDGAFDIYARFDEDYMIIQPHTVRMIPTSIASAFSSDYVAILKERGSTGIKGIGQKAGVIDSGYRNEWFVPLMNHNNRPLVIAKDYVDIDTIDEIYNNGVPLSSILYPYEKAITQCIMVEVPKLAIKEVCYDDLLSLQSERGKGALGSSGK